MLAAVLQMCSSEDVTENLAQAAILIEQAAKQGAKLAVLPEMFAIMGRSSQDKVLLQEIAGQGKIQDFLAEQAKKHQIWLVGGTIPLTTDEATKVRAACCVYNEHGILAARYDKIHLFDVELSAKEKYNESDTTQAGNEVVVIDTPVGRLGLAVCYDLRFPELFRLMFEKGAEIIAIPAAFTVPTGEAHWELLARSRAVENFCYILGACQGGVHSNGRKTYGHSLIVNPWGVAQIKQDQEPGVLTGEIDLKFLEEKRRAIPIAEHQKYRYKKWSSE